MPATYPPQLHMARPRTRGTQANDPNIADRPSPCRIPGKGAPAKRLDRCCPARRWTLIRPEPWHPKAEVTIPMDESVADEQARAPIHAEAPKSFEGSTKAACWETEAFRFIYSRLMTIQLVQGVCTLAPNLRHSYHAPRPPASPASPVAATKCHFLDSNVCCSLVSQTNK